MKRNVYIFVEIDQLFVVQEFIGIGDVSRHGIRFALGAESGFIVHPLELVDNFRENAADIFDHLVHRLTGGLFEIFADVHGANGIAKATAERKKGRKLVNKTTFLSALQTHESKELFWRGERNRINGCVPSYILPFDFLALCQTNTKGGICK